MAINSAIKKAKDSTQKPTTSTAAKGKKERRKAPLAGYEERASTLRIYVKDKNLLKEAKLAALQDDVSLSQLWEEWAIQWLEGRK